MVRKRVVSIASLLLMVVCITFIVIFNNQSVASANIVPSPIYAAEDTTMIYESGMIYEGENLGYLEVGYQGTFSVPLEAQVLLKFALPQIPTGYEVETANLYIPVTGGTLQATTNFSLKVSTSIDHSWAQDSRITSPPALTSGSTQSRLLANNVPLLKPTLAPFNFTSYISGESAKSDPRATFILSGMTSQEAAEAGITYADHFIQMTENHAHGGSLGPYLIITYSEIANIEITGVADGGLYNTNVTPTFNTGTATLNGSPFTSETQLTAEGSYTLTVTAGSQLETIQFRIDKTPPTGMIIVNLGNEYTNGSAVLISINPDPGVTDITHIQYSLNGSPYTQMPYVPSFMLSIGFTDGDKVLRFKLVDRAGNQSTEYQKTITRDTEVPTGSIVINNGNVYTTNREITLNLSLGNGVTDVVAVQFSNNNSSWSGVEAFSSIKSYTLPAGDGNKTVYVRLIDRAGNITVIQDSIILDTTPPTGTVVVNDGRAYTNDSNVYVDITPTAGVTDIVSIRYTLNGLPPTTIAYTNSFTINVGSTDGEKAITVELIDEAGRVSPLYSATVTLDTIPPVVSGVAEGGSYTSSQTITFNEGTATLNGGSFVSGTTVDTDGSYVLVVTDSAGNSTTITFIINKPAPIRYSVKYDGNGATGGQEPVDSQSYENGHTVTVSDNSGNLVRTGFTFDGWNTSADGSGVSYLANHTFNINASDVTLYALWKVNSYTLSFQSNGGTVVPTQNISYNVTATAPTAPTKPGYTFGGWFKETALINQWNFTRDAITANMTLYAKWIQNNSSENNGGGNSSTLPQRLIVFFETNGGNVLNNLSVVYDTRLAELPTPTKEGYTFGGWYHDMALTNKWDITKDRVTKDATLSLYAKWIANTVSVPAANPQSTPEEPKPERPVVAFDDLSGHWAKEMIEELASQGIITGYPDGSFYPNENIKRHHMALIFIRAFEFEPKREAVSFSDVSPSHPYYEAIMSLQQAGIVDGSNGDFQPNHSLTRAQMAKILTLALEIEPGGTRTFQDIPTTHWSFDYVAALAELEIVLGDNNGKFKPDEPVTRAQFAVMMYRALNMSK
ncbi:putative repeat protein (TIGR02543 family) [Paenibacillus amylolyticus]|uniref:Repeat protein (TIGR02543 family) n=1 Tax=Paenibacillus amylolyticus TaxID=1451 RepID=A0AAP5GVZ7_PAEAM|nr:putative repeat protein (TIGR02543 family) [Paenibacillus amylolyticus]